MSRFVFVSSSILLQPRAFVFGSAADCIDRNQVLTKMYTEQILRKHEMEAFEEVMHGFNPSRCHIYNRSVWGVCVYMMRNTPKTTFRSL